MEFRVSQESPITAQQVQDGEHLLLPLMAGVAEVRIVSASQAGPNRTISAREIDHDGRTSRKSVKLHFNDRGVIDRITY